MDPVGATVGGLFDELVEVAIVDDSGEPLVEKFHVGVMLAVRVHEVIDWDVDVGCLASLVLGVLHASYKGVELWGTIAGINHNGAIEVLAQGFEELFTEVLAILIDIMAGW